jgi:hypothetical protein
VPERTPEPLVDGLQTDTAIMRDTIVIGSGIGGLTAAGDARHERLVPSRAVQH